MNLSKQSAIYKFVDESWMLEEFRTRDNLCPFARIFILGVFMSFVIYTLFILAALSAVAAPFLWFMEPAGIWTLVLVAGTIVDIVGICILLVIADDKYRAARSVGDAVRTASRATGFSALLRLLGGWLKAIHDKTCPELTFVE